MKSMDKGLWKFLAFVFAAPLVLLLLILAGTVAWGIMEGPTICELVIDNRGNSSLQDGTVLLNRRPSPKQMRKLPAIAPRTRVTFELDEFYTEPGGTLTFTRANGSKVSGEFGYIDGGETWRYKLAVTDDSSRFDGTMIRREELRAKP